MAEIRLARAEAWSAADFAEIRLLLGLEIKLLGTAAPTRKEITGADGGPVQIEDLSAEERAARIVEILRRVERRKTLEELSERADS